MGIARGLTHKSTKFGMAVAQPAWLGRTAGAPGQRTVTIAEISLIELLRREGEMTKSDLATRTDFSRTKITTCIDSLLYKQILVANESTEYSGGRRSKSFRLNEKLGLVAGIQIGAIGFDLGIADFSGRLIAKRSEPALVKDGPIPTLGHACSALEEMLAELGMLPESVLGIGIGVPGPVDFGAGTVVSPPIMPGWDRYPIVATVRQWFPQANVLVDNDVNVMALGEVNHGAARGVANLISVKIGTGIGAGIICDGRIYRGSSGCAGDIGHICVDNDGPVCACGNKGCLEKIAGGAGIAERATAGARSGRSATLLSAYEKNGNKLHAEDVGAAAMEGDEFAIEVVRESGRQVGEVLAALVNFYNPDMIVIGGGVSNLGNLLLSSIRQAVFSRSLPLATRNLQIVLSGIGSDSGMLGALSLGLNYVLMPEPKGTNGARKPEMEQL
jgi:glucokinase-like ROK family protein